MKKIIKYDNVEDWHYQNMKAKNKLIVPKKFVQLRCGCTSGVEDGQFKLKKVEGVWIHDSEKKCFVAYHRI